MRVAYKIIAEGEDITALIGDRLESLNITDQAGVTSDRLTLTVDDRDQLLEFPRRGAKLEVSLGYSDRPLVKMGTYTVDEVEVSGPARSMTIRATAADMTGGIKAPKERSFDGITLGALVRTVAADNGLRPSIPSDLASRDLGHVDQTESDMNLLQRICAEQGATCKVADTRLVVAVRAAGKTETGADMPEAVIDAGDCESWSAAVTGRTDYKSVTAYWQDVKKARRTGVRAGSGSPALTIKNTFSSETEARRAAESKLKALKSGAGKVTINGLIGDPTVAAEMTASLSGFRRGVDGDGWVVNSVTHNFTGEGYTCGLELEAK